jgi:hypothetical protein
VAAAAANITAQISCVALAAGLEARTALVRASVASGTVALIWLLWGIQRLCVCVCVDAEGCAGLVVHERSDVT